ncbi:14211_t:CDS:1, partial [Funneliformis mosseae]
NALEHCKNSGIISHKEKYSRGESYYEKHTRDDLYYVQQTKVMFP